MYLEAKGSLESGLKVYLKETIGESEYQKLRGKRKKNKKLVEKLLTNRKKTVIIMDVVKYVPLAQLDRATAF